MRKRFTRILAALALLVCMTPSLAGWGQTTTTYTFSSKSWAASPANWTSNKDGNQMQSGRGVQVTTGVSGAGCTSPASYTNITGIVVTYSTNSKEGAGSIQCKVGSYSETKTVTKTGGTTDRILSFTPTTTTGYVTITVTCTQNSIYVKSVAITYTPKVATPTFSPAAGNYASSQDVTISTGTAGATIYYTTDGTTPTTSSTPYSGSISVTESTTIKALAVKADMLDSDVAIAEYNIVSSTQDLYVTSAHGNVTVTVNNETVALTGDHYVIPEGATVNLSVAPIGNYVLRGWIIDSGGVSITDNAFTMPSNEVHITAKYASLNVDELTHTNVNAAMSGNSGYQSWSITANNSGAVYAGYSNYSLKCIQINKTSPSGIVSTTSGGYIRKIKLTWDDDNASGRSITVYGKNTPYNSASELYSNGTSGTELGTLTYNESDELEITSDYYYFGIKANGGAAYFEPLEISWQPLPAAPSFSPVGGTYNNNQSVEITCGTEGATIHYTTDGTEPNENSTTYTGAIAVNATTTIKAAAIKNGEQGPTASATYTLKCATPTFTPASGTLEIGATIALSSSTVGATLHYSTDNGDTWQEGSSVTTTVTTSTVKAKATKAGYSESDVETATYSIYQVATPTFTVAGGTYSNDQSVGINCGTEGATIRYTTNGTEPNENSTVYDGAIAVNATTTIKAKAFKNNWISSAENSATYTLKCAKPTFDPESGGTLEIGATIALSSTTTDAVLWYSIDEGESWQEGDEVTTAATTSTVQAKATKAGYSESDVETATYSIYQVATPTFTVAGGTYNSDQSVGITCETEGATIRYTTDGTEPTTSSTAYNNTAISVTTTTTIKAKAYKDNWIPSAENSATYTLKCATPTFDPASGTLEIGATIALSSTTAGAALHYSTDNGESWQDGPSVTTTATTSTVKAKATKDGYSESDEATATYSIYQVATPTFTVAGGTYNSDQSVEINCVTEGATIHYTTNGDEPDENSTVYSTAIPVTTTTTIKAKAFKSNWIPSSEFSATYTLKCDTPTITVSGLPGSADNTYYNTASVEISAATGTTIYYTTNGDDPTTSSSQYTSALTFDTPSTTTTIKAIAVKANYQNSAIASQTVTIIDAWTVTLNSNGICHEKMVVKGQALSLSAPDIIPSGYAYKGWTLDPYNASTMVGNSYTPSGNVTLYAVYGTITYGDFSKVTSAPDDWSGRYLIVRETSTTAGYAFKGSLTTTLGNVSNYMDVTISSSTITKTDNLSSNIFVISKISNTNNYSIQSASGYYIGRAAGSNGFDSSTTVVYPNSISTSGIYGTTNGNANTAKLQFFDNKNSEQFKYYTSTQKSICLYKQSVTTDPSSYETSISAPVSSDITITTPTVITNGAVLDMGTKTLTCADPSNLIIEDGGQLITNNSVKATVKKTITGHGAKATYDGWTFIASPVVVEGGVNPAAVSGMINATATKYDLYRFNDGVDKEWENYKNTEDHPNFTLVYGKGYLYANEDGTSLDFAGDVNPSTPHINVSLQYTEGQRFAGWNLVGNPFTADAYITNMSYYRMENDGKGNVVINPSSSFSGAIKPCEGVMVKANDGGENVTFTTTEPEGSANNGNINIALAQIQATRGEKSLQTLDNAIVSFNEGSELGKFYFGTQKANIYIPLDNEEYAIVSSNAQGEMPVNFRAYEAGEYTITVNPEEVEMGYLHLIDNVAGKDIDLLATPSYTFNAKGDDYESRFRLVFSANMVNAEMGEDFAFMSDGQLVIANEGEATLQVIDVTGRVVANENINGTCSKAINAKAGVYVLRLINGTDVKTQKMVIR